MFQCGYTQYKRSWNAAQLFKLVDWNLLLYNLTLLFKGHTKKNSRSHGLSLEKTLK